MTLEVTQGHRVWRYSLGHFLQVVCKNVSILHDFRDITTFALYVTASDLRKSFSFHPTVKFIVHIRCRICFFCCFHSETVTVGQNINFTRNFISRKELMLFFSSPITVVIVINRATG